MREDQSLLEPSREKQQGSNKGSRRKLVSTNLHVAQASELGIGIWEGKAIMAVPEDASKGGLP